jgi:hypothetical protein
LLLLKPGGGYLSGGGAAFSCSNLKYVWGGSGGRLIENYELKELPAESKFTQEDNIQMNLKIMCVNILNRIYVYRIIAKWRTFVKI